MAYTKDEIIKEIQRIATDLGVSSLKRSDFSRHSKGVSVSTVRYYFGSWNEAVQVAGLSPTDSRRNFSGRGAKYSDNELLLDLIRLQRETGRPPSEATINAQGRFSARPYTKRFGSIREALQLAQMMFPEELVTNPNGPAESIAPQTVKIVPETIKPRLVPGKKRVVFGEPIDFRGLRFAPVNEQGVVYLFGKISHELGYLIESIRTEYPDCEGKRCFDKENNKWEHVRIEFEYRSLNFREHGHDECGCDIIVCWIHDWEDCPVEVLELKSVIRFL